MKKLFILFLLSFSFAAHAQHANDKGEIGNWDVSKEGLYAALMSDEKSSLTADQEKQKTALIISCNKNELSVSFLWIGSIFPGDYESKNVEVSLQWDSNKPDNMVLLAYPADLLFPDEMGKTIIDNLKKHKTLTLRIRDQKKKWDLTGTFKLNGVEKAIAVPISTCQK